MDKMFTKEDLQRIVDNSYDGFSDGKPLFTERHLAAELLQSRQTIAVLTEWKDNLSRGDSQSVEMAFVNFRNWTSERQRSLGIMLLPDYLTLTERLKAARDDAERLYEALVEATPAMDPKYESEISQHLALVAQEAGK